MSRWPSRRFQIGTMIVLALGAAVQVFIPPVTKQSRAEKLYLDGWFEESVPKLEKALDLDPGNSVYEQALVYQYPKDKLPDLLKKRHLGMDARRLAAGLIYQNQIARTEDPNRQLALADALIKADPTNALPHYRKAGILQEMGELDASLAEMKRGNDCGKMRLYSPTVPNAVLDSGQSPILDPMFSDYAFLRRLVRASVDNAHIPLREGKVEQSAGMMEDSLCMGAIVSSTEPPVTIGILVGMTLLKITTSAFEPICKDFGMSDQLAAIKRLDKAYERAHEACKEEINYSGLEKMYVISAIPYAFLWAAGSAAGFLALSLLWWILPAIRRRGQPAVNLSSWGEGWIARASLIVNMPLLVAAVLLGAYTADFGELPDYLGPYALLIVLAQIIILVLGVRILHHRRDQDTGEKTGIPRFIFKSPAAVKAWTRKSLMLLFAGQIAFAACLALLAIILCKPILGGHPWQINRFQLLTISHEEAAMRRVGDDLRKAYYGR